jgi:hypothetical protein
MKTAKSIIVVLFVLLTAQITSAYYCPSTGRWLSRDPIGEPGFQTAQMASVVPRSSQLALRRWINRDSIGKPELGVMANRLEDKAATHQSVHFQDGLAELMAANPTLAARINEQIAQLENSSNTKIDSSSGNLYLFVQNDPLLKSDPLGLDIYYHYCAMLCACSPRIGFVSAWTLWPVSPYVQDKACQQATKYFCSAVTTGSYWALLEATEIYYQAYFIANKP